MHKAISDNEFGFTLIELLVGIGIITMLFALYAINYKDTNARNQLNVAAQEMVSNIRVAQNNSLQGKFYNSAPAAGGWGVDFDLSQPDRYIVFADTNQNHSLDAGEADAGLGALPIYLPSAIKLFKLQEKFPLEDTARLDAVFLPPDPYVYVNSNDYMTEPGLQGVIWLRDDRSGQIKKININFFGLIEVIE